MGDDFRLTAFRWGGVGDVGDVFGLGLQLLGGGIELLTGLDTHRHQRAGDGIFDGVQHLPEQLKSLALVLLLGLLLGVAAQMDALAQVIQGAEVVAPMRINGLQQHHALKAGEVLGANLLHFASEQGLRDFQHVFEDVLIGHGLRLGHRSHQIKTDLPVGLQSALQPGQVPLLFHRLVRHVLAHEIGDSAFTQGRHLGVQIIGIQNRVALLVNHFALVVGDVVVFQQLLAHVEIACLHLALRALDAARDHAGFNGFTLGHVQALHDGLDALAREDAHQRVVQTQIKA